MTTYKGKLVFKQYLKDKNKCFGLKFFTKASSDKGYIYHILPYEGKGFEYDKKIGLGASILKKFSTIHENNSYHFTFDNYYANIFSISHLYNNEIDFTCAFLSNRKGFPETIKNIKIEKGENKLFKLNYTKIIFYFYKPKEKQVQFISNKYSAKMVKYKKKIR